MVRVRGVVSGTVVGSPSALPRSQRCTSVMLVVSGAQGGEEGMMRSGPMSGQIADVVVAAACTTLSCLYLIDLGKGLATCLHPHKTRCTLPSWSLMVLHAQAPFSVSAAPPLHYTSMAKTPPDTFLYLDTKKQRRQTAAWRET